MASYKGFAHLDTTGKVEELPAGVVPVANGGTNQTSYTDGQLLIGNTSTGGLNKATLTAGSNVTITNAGGSITIASTNGGGTVTSVTASSPLASSGGTTPDISFSGTLPVANGGTGSATQNFVDLTTTQNVSGSKTFTDSLNISFGKSYLSNGVLLGRLQNGNGLFSRAGNATLNGNSNECLGYQAGLSLTSGNINTFLGDNSGGVITSGNANVAIGNNALGGKQIGSNTSTGSYNVAIGSEALGFALGSSNIAIGNGAGERETGDNKFYIDNQFRGTESAGRTGALIYGVMDASAINQVLTVNAIIKPIQAATASAPTYQKGAIYFDTTLNKLRVGGATAWETITST